MFNNNEILFAKDLISSNVGIVDILMKDASSKCNSAKNHEEVFRFFLLELLISIQKKKIAVLYEGKYINIIDNEYYNYLISQNIPENVIDSMKISYQKKYSIYKESICFEKLLSEKLFHLILDFFSFIDIQKGTNYKDDDNEVSELLLLIFPFLESTNQLSKDFIFNKYKI